MTQNVFFPFFSFYEPQVNTKWTKRKWDGPLQYTNSASGDDLMMLPTDMVRRKREKRERKKGKKKLDLEKKKKTLVRLTTTPTKKNSSSSSFSQALIWDRKFRPHVHAYAKDEALFFQDFAKAFSKLLELGVPRGGAAAAASPRE